MNNQTPQSYAERSANKKTDGNGSTVQPAKAEIIHELITATAVCDPNKSAVSFEGQELTYRELDSRANQVAHHLNGNGLVMGDLVGIYVERSLEMLVALLGVLKAGGTYVPLDPNYPADRIAYMLQDSNAKFILCQGALVDSLPPHQAQTFCLDTDWESFDKRPDTPVSITVGTNDLAYVIYTSGSTGLPKGVAIPHRSVVNFLRSMGDKPGLDSHDRLLAVTTLSFDIAGLELYLPLTVGAHVVIASRPVASDGIKLAQAIVANDITVMQATPATWRVLLDSDWQGKDSLRVFCGGEALTRELAERLLPKCSEVWNLYGPTETTIWSTVARVRSGSGPISIGSPIANTEVVILDENLNEVSPGTPGELYIGGDGLARGYLNREELTSERFIDHPLQATAGAKLYRTGDLAKMLTDGSFEHLGRVDFQVKVRGFRIELGEIEAVLDSLDAVQQSVVMAREDVPGDKKLVGYVVPATANKLSIRGLREALAATLPDYMIPGSFVSLDEFPLTPNGKIDRNALPAPDSGRSMLTDDYLAPSTEDEILLANIWASVLRVDKVGLNDNFFELGGDSLKVAQVATRIREEFHTEMFLSKMFQNPTVASLLREITASETLDESDHELPIASVARGEYIPLSFAQERVWFLYQVNPDNLAYNFQASIDLNGPLNVAALERTLDEILRRHESYRTSFPTIAGRPAQIVHAATPYTLPIIDLSLQPESERDAAAQAWCKEEFQHRFELDKIPLVRWALLRYSDTRNVLIHMEHHLVHDGWAFNLFIHELVDLYTAYSQDKPSPLAEIPVQFAEFATWQHEWMQGEVSDKQLAYWKKKFSTIPPVLELPTKGPRPAAQTFVGHTLRPEIPLALCNELRALSRREGSTMFMTMLAGFAALLHRYTGETDIAIGTFFANRRSTESESLIGMILNNVVIRAALDSNPTVRELLHHLRDVVLEGASHQDVPFDRVVDAVQIKRDMSHNPLFQVMFSFHDEPMPESGMLGLDAKVTPVLSNGSAKFDLGVIGIPHSAQQLGLPQGSDQDGLTMIWEHNTDLFETATIARMIEHYKSLLQGMTHDPDARISELPLATASELQQILVDWNDTSAQRSEEACLHTVIEAQAKATPNAIAVVYESTELTYAELDSRANQLANHLTSKGVGPNALVGICVNRSERMLIGLLAILKAGGAYVPIDPTFPVERQQFMVDDSSLSLVLTELDLTDKLSLNQIGVVRLDADTVAIESNSTSFSPLPNVTAESLAYIIYTSGSTGKPKGVQIPHRAIVNFLNSMRARPGMDSDDRLFAVTTLSFDIAGLELYLPLTVGARVIIGSRSVAINGQELMAQLESTGATIMQATPTSWQMLLDSGWNGESIKTALCGGEALPRSLAEQLVGKVTNLWNMYGPTETTIWSTIHKIDAVGGSIPIGRPIDNTQIYILDHYDNLVPAGVTGELCIGGQGVALGYLNRPELSAERFIDNPVPDSPKGKIYRTGDLARFRADGTIECLGRTDHQIKLRGFRIELGEIESQIDLQTGVKQSVVVMREDSPGDQRLVAYAVPATSEKPESNDILAALRTVLPNYMVPNTCVILDAIPLTPNGKVDRQKLPVPQNDRKSDIDPYIAPRSDLEKQLQEIWETLLGVQPVGMQDDFFDVGGHSLLAIRLISQIESKTGKRVSVASLLQGRTIEHVAGVIGGDEPTAKTGSFLAIHPNGSKRPFFAVGSHPRYVEIANMLSAAQPFYQLDAYALQSQRIADGLKPYNRIEQFATHYLNDLRQVQADGPYHLGGGCEGAYIAYEMATRLQQEGQEIGSLTMWIPPPLQSSKGLSLRRAPLYHSALRLQNLWAADAFRGANRQSLNILLQHEGIEFRFHQALCAYSPSTKFQGEIALVRTEISPPGRANINQQWIDLATNGAVVNVVPGSHGNWLHEHLDNFVNVIRKQLSTAENGP